MAWDPAVLRKYNTTGHFRLLNQVRSELKGNPLIRPKAGETVGAANRSRSLTRALEIRAQAGPSRSRRAQANVEVMLAPPELRSEGPSPRQSRSPWESAMQQDESGSETRWTPIALGPGTPTLWDEAEAEQPGGPDNGGGSFRDRLNAIEMR